ncbi:hypothetical protein BJV74DRAFT_835350 [Russula compacta]|nr:hypothetical protein BJV74DRAFT_835350 [Russula compacta]
MLVLSSFHCIFIPSPLLSLGLVSSRLVFSAPASCLNAHPHYSRVDCISYSLSPLLVSPNCISFYTMTTGPL